MIPELANIIMLDYVSFHIIYTQQGYLPLSNRENTK